jgi:hypothetical protein
VTISADIAERMIVGAVKDLLEEMRGTASMDDGIADAERRLDACEQELDAAVRAFSVLDDVDAARDRLAELKDARDEAR